MARATKATANAGPDLFSFAIAQELNLLEQLPSNVYLFSKVGITPGFQQAWDEFYGSCKDFAIDTETYHVDSQKSGLEWDASIRLISICPEPNTPGKGEIAFVLDLGCKNIPDTLPSQDIQIYLEQLQELCESSDVRKWGQNIKFDMVRLRADLGWELRNIGDTMLMSQVYWNFAPAEGFSHNFQAISERLGFSIDKQEQASDWANGNLGYGKLSPEQYIYSAKDTLLLWQLIPKLQQMINRQGLDSTLKTEFLFCEVLADMEFQGFYVDYNKAKEYLKIYQAQDWEFTNKIVESFGCDIKDKKLKARLEEMSGKKVDSISAEVLSEFLHIKGIPELILRRSLRKYMDVLKTIVEKGSGGCLHTNFTQHLFTARTASKEPNLQNIPNGAKTPKALKHLPSVRSLFVAPAGKKFIISDLSAAHARIAIEASKDQVLIEFYNEDKDIHLFTASLVAQALGDDLSFEQMSKIYQDKQHPKFSDVKRYRNMAKNVFYGSLNLQGYKTLQATILEQTGELIEDEQAKAIITKFKEGYCGLSSYMRNICQDANKERHTFHKFGLHKEYAKIKGLTGRYAYHAKLESQYNPDAPATAKSNDMVAFIWASSEADIMKWSAILLKKKFDQNPHWQARIANFVHDEVDVYCAEEYAETVASITLEIMDNCMKRVIKCIPVNDANVTPASLIVSSWADK